MFIFVQQIVKNRFFVIISKSKKKGVLSICVNYPLHYQGITSLYLQALGKVGKVLKVYADSDLRVSIGDNEWTFNPACCISVSVEQQQEDINNTMVNSTHDRHDHTSKMLPSIFFLNC